MDLATILRGILVDAKYEEIRELAAGNPATDSSIPPNDGSCPLNRLPRELRDMIFKHTYGRLPGGLKIMFKAHVDLYGKCKKFTRHSRNVSMIYLAYASVLALQRRRYSGLRVKLTATTSLFVLSITLTGSSFTRNGHLKPPRLCSPAPRFALGETPREPSSRTHA